MAEEEVKHRRPSCGNCQSWHPTSYASGECRFNAPTPDKYHHAKFPTIGDFEWCREHLYEVFDPGDHVIHDNGKCCRNLAHKDNGPVRAPPEATASTEGRMPTRKTIRTLKLLDQAYAQNLPPPEFHHWEFNELTGSVDFEETMLLLWPTARAMIRKAREEFTPPLVARSHG